MDKDLVAYRRVSSKKQGQSGLGLEVQERDIHHYVAFTGGRLLHAYTEVESGKEDTLANRPELIKAISHARMAGATLVIAKLDRLARSVYVTAELHKSGIEFVCCDNPNANRMTIQILAVMAEQESKANSVRTKSSLKVYKDEMRTSKRINLIHPEGVPPEVVEATAGKLGSHLPQCQHNLKQPARVKGAAAAGVAHRRSADEAYAHLIGEVRKWRGEGESQQGIADRLNAAGYGTRRGKPWNQVQVLRILRRFGAA